MLSPNALRVLDSVGLYKRIRDKALQFDILSFKDGEGNTVDQFYFGSEKLYGYDAIRIMRKPLLDEMKALLRERHIPVRFESKLTKITRDGPDSVEFELESGETASAPLLVGADGINSTVRESFLPGVKPIYAGFLGVSGVVQRSQLRLPDGYVLPATVMGKAGAFLLVPQKPDGSELFIGHQRRHEPLDAAGWDALRRDKQRLYDMLQEHRADWPDVVRSALDAAPVDRMGFWAFHGVPPLPSWLSASKRVILIGDAVHAIPPTAGQGANQAFEDARSLATVLARLAPDAPLDEAAEKWQACRKDRVRRVLELTQQMNVKRLPEAERAKLPPEAFWDDPSLTRGEGGQLRWLYDPDLAQEAEGWIQELKQAAGAK